MALWLSIVLDGVGIGHLPDAKSYGDEGSHTLGHVLARCKPSLPNLKMLGLGNIAQLEGVGPMKACLASYGKMAEASVGKDSTTGHWELAGILLDKPFPTFPNGIPSELADRFLEKTGFDRGLSLMPTSGTTVLEDFGGEHLKSGQPIIYTSADSVVQIATHLDVIPLEKLYEICEVMRTEICVGDFSVGRVIARPFSGEPGNFTRHSDHRKDYSLKPKKKCLQSCLQEKGVHTISVGKVASLFDWLGFDRFIKTGRNEIGIKKTLSAISECRPDEDTFMWVNLIDFDQEFGHRNNPEGFAESLEEFDRAVPAILASMRKEDALCITADHGNDPSYPGTDHTREYVPLLLCQQSGGVRDLGVRSSFVDHAASVADFFGLEERFGGVSFAGPRHPGRKDH